MTLMEKRINEILNQPDQTARIAIQEIISTFRIYLEQRDQAQWGKVFEGVATTMRRAKSFDFDHFDREVHE